MSRGNKTTESMMTCSVLLGNKQIHFSGTQFPYLHELVKLDSFQSLVLPDL